MTVELTHHSYKNTINAYDVLKVIAIVTMIIDHVGMYFYPETLWMRAIGRIAFPLFLFLVGYSNQYSFSKPVVMGGLALIAVDAWTHYPIFPINILATIVITRFLMQLAVRKNWLALPIWQIHLVLIIWYIPSMLVFEYGSVAIMYALAGYYARQNTASDTPFYHSLIFATLFHAITQYALFDFKGWDIAIMVVALGFASMCMRHVSTTALHMKNTLMQNTVKFVSRHALIIYVLHIALFQIVETILHPGNLP